MDQKDYNIKIIKIVISIVVFHKKSSYMQMAK